MKAWRPRMNLHDFAFFKVAQCFQVWNEFVTKFCLPVGPGPGAPEGRYNASYWFTTVVCVILSRTRITAKTLFWSLKFHDFQIFILIHPRLRHQQKFDNPRMGTTILAEIRDMNAVQTSVIFFFHCSSFHLPWFTLVRRSFLYYYPVLY